MVIRNRWITVPLAFALIWSVTYTLFGFVESISGFIGWFCTGALTGFLIQYYSDVRARSKSGLNTEEIYGVRQDKTISLMQNIDEAFDSCVAAIQDTGIGKIKSEDRNNHTITVRTRISWDSFGNIFTVRLTEIDQNLTEVNIKTRPFPRTVLVDYGEGWTLSERLIERLRQTDKELSKRSLVDGAGLIMNATVRPIDFNIGQYDKKQE